MSSNTRLLIFGTIGFIILFIFIIWLGSEIRDNPSPQKPEAQNTVSSISQQEQS